MATANFRLNIAPILCRNFPFFSYFSLIFLFRGNFVPFKPPHAQPAYGKRTDADPAIWLNTIIYFVALSFHRRHSTRFHAIVTSVT